MAHGLARIVIRVGEGCVAGDCEREDLVGVARALGYM